MSTKNENWQRGLGLTTEQKAFREIWQALRPHQAAGRPYSGSAICFGPARGQKLLPGSLQPLEAVEAIAIMPVPRHMLGERARTTAAFRLHLTRMRPEVVDGEITFRGVYEADAGKPPIQDHPRWREEVVASEIMGVAVTERPVFLAPQTGAARLVDAWFGDDLVIGEQIVARFPVGLAEILGDQATAGEPIVRFVKDGRYLRATGSIDRIGGDVLPARDGRLVSIATALLRALTVPASSPLPSPQALISAETFSLRRELGWTPNAVVRAGVMEAVGLHGDLAVRAPAADGPYVLTEELRLDHVKQFVLSRPDGGKVRINAPKSAELSVLIGSTLNAGDAFADFVPRCAYDSYDQLCDVVTQVAELEDAYMRTACPEVLGGRMVPVALLGELAAHAVRYFLDFGKMPRVTLEGTHVPIYAPTLFPLHAELDTQVRVNRVTYDATPKYALASTVSTRVDTSTKTAPAKPEQKIEQHPVQA